MNGRRGRSHGFVRPRSRTRNLKIREPGSHRFGDYWRLGLPLLLFGVVAVLFFGVLGVPSMASAPRLSAAPRDRLARR